MATGTAFDVDLFEELRSASGVSLGHPLTALAVATSTNDLALDAARAGAPHGATFVADLQTAGRGRRGRSWTSPTGENLTASLLLRPSVSAERAGSLSLVVGLAVRAAVAPRVNRALGVKWPNDVVVGGKKLCGILVESRLVGTRVDAVVVGLGVNVHMREAPDEIRGIATSLALLGDPLPSRESVLAEFLVEFETRYGQFLVGGLLPLVEELRTYDALIGEHVTVGDLRGTAEGIDENGALLVRGEDGALHRVTAGTVERG